MATQKINRLKAKGHKLGVKTASIASRKQPATRNPDGSVKERDKTGGAAARKAAAAKPVKRTTKAEADAALKRVVDERAKHDAEALKLANKGAPVSIVVNGKTERAEVEAFVDSLNPVSERTRDELVAKLSDNGQAPATEPPPVVEAEELAPAQSIELPANIVRAALAIAGKDDTRYYLNSVFIHQLPDKALRLVATDGHRMLVASLPQETTIDWAKKGAIIPSEHLTRVVRYLGNKAEVVDLAFGVDHRQVVIAERDGIATFAIPVIAEQYPAYQKLCDAAAAVFSAEREELAITQLDARYLKSAGAIAALLGSRGIIPFLAEDGAKIASVFAFDQAPGVLLYIMPQAARQEALPAATTRLFGKAAMEATLAKLEEAIKRSRNNAKTAKHKKFRDQSTARADRLQARADQLRAALSTKLTGPAPAAQEKAPQQGSDVAGPTVH